jgi:hypothetical protein
VTLLVKRSELFLLRRGFALSFFGRFSLKAAKRVHHNDSKRIGVESVVGLDISLPLPSSIVVVVAIRVTVVAVDGPDASRVRVAVVVR